MSIREDFERAFKDWVNITCLNQMSVGPDDAALWAAKWMAERCARETEKVNSGRFTYGEIIRSLAQELSR